MEGQVTVPGGAVAFPVEKVSTMTTIVISPTVRGACGGRYYYGFSRRLRDWVGSHYRCPRGRNPDLHFPSCPI